MNDEIEISKTFIPFMVGSISLVAYVSLRNFKLAERARQLSEKLIDLNKKSIDGVRLERGRSLVKQIELFLRRYKLSNYALFFAIFAVMFFGSMIACYVFASLNFLVKFCMVFGGFFGTLATVWSMCEAFLAPDSLSEEIASLIWCSRQSLADEKAKNATGSICTMLSEETDSNLKTELREFAGQSAPPNNGWVRVYRTRIRIAFRKAIQRISP